MTAKNNQYTDQELLQKYLQSQENEWLGILLQRYTLLLFGVSMKYLKDENEAKDAVQQIFLKVIQEVHKYKIDYFKSWLYMVAKNQCLTILRNKKINIPADLLEERLEEEKDEVDDWSEDDEKEKLLETSLQELNEAQRQSVTLFYLQKKTYHEISEITKYSLLQVKSYIQNGKRNLGIIIEGKLKQKNKQNV